jgi:hypothetical protein
MVLGTVLALGRFVDLQVTTIEQSHDFDSLKK